MTPRLYAELIGLAVLLGAFWWYTEHEREIGEQKCRDQVSIALVAQQQEQLKKQVNQAADVIKIEDTYHEAITKPVTDAPVIRVCNDTVRTKSVSSASSASSRSDASPVVRETDTPVVTEWDSAPVIDAGRDADAQVTALQTYIREVCLK